MGLAHCIHQVIKLRWKSGLKSPESWSNVTEVGTEVLLGSNLGDILAEFDQGSGPSATSTSTSDWWPMNSVCQPCQNLSRCWRRPRLSYSQKKRALIRIKKYPASRTLGPEGGYPPSLSDMSVLLFLGDVGQRSGPPHTFFFIKNNIFSKIKRAEIHKKYSLEW